MSLLSNIVPEGSIILKSGEDQVFFDRELLAKNSLHFKNMITSNMKEKLEQTKDGILTCQTHFEIDHLIWLGFKLKFKDGCVINNECISYALEMADYYQIEFIKKECDIFLSNQKPNVYTFQLFNRYSCLKETKKQMFQYLFETCDLEMKRLLLLELDEKTLVDFIFFEGESSLKRFIGYLNCDRRDGLEVNLKKAKTQFQNDKCEIASAKDYKNQLIINIPQSNTSNRPVIFAPPEELGSNNLVWFCIPPNEIFTKTLTNQTPETHVNYIVVIPK